jgi:uncharacterized protein (DUF952 family)
MIYHLLPQAVWAAQPADQPYRAPSLVTERFIHCTAEVPWLVQVANTFYRHEDGAFVILCVEETQVTAPIQWEKVDNWRFPHIYGPLSPDAIRAVVPFPRTASGEFLVPEELQ